MTRYRVFGKELKPLGLVSNYHVHFGLLVKYVSKDLEPVYFNSSRSASSFSKAALRFFTSSESEALIPSSLTWFTNSSAFVSNSSTCPLKHGYFVPQVWDHHTNLSRTHRLQFLHYVHQLFLYLRLFQKPCLQLAHFSVLPLLPVLFDRFLGRVCSSQLP